MSLEFCNPARIGDLRAGDMIRWPNGDRERVKDVDGFGPMRIIDFANNTATRPIPATGLIEGYVIRSSYKSQSARDAEADNYGGKKYWKYLDGTAQRHYDYFMAKGDKEKAESMLTQTLSEALMGNDGD